MEIDTLLSTQTAAEMLGVSVSTVKRWVDDAILPAHKSPGGHRKILLNDIIRLSRNGTLPPGDFSRMKVNSSVTESKLDVSSDLFYQAIRSQSDLSATNLLVSAYRSKIPLTSIVDNIIQPAMAKIGYEWETGILPIFFEHCSTQICLSAILELRSLISSTSVSEKPVAIGGCSKGDQHLLCTLLVDIVLLDLGWKTINTGANTPLQSFFDGIDFYKPKVVWMSVTSIPNIEDFLEDNQKLFEKVCQNHSVLIMGGQALTLGVRKKLKFHFYGDTMTHLGAYASGLVPLIGLPQRGRPSTSA